MNGHFAHHSGSFSHSDWLSGLIANVANDIATLVKDIFQLLEAQGCHPCPPPIWGQPPCYCPGTMILTNAGEVAVERLAVGDTVLTSEGASRPIRWIGRRTLDITRHVAPDSVRPVRIMAGALGDNLPHRDLRVSPGHSIMAEDVLIPVRFLLNGTTIAQEPSTRNVTYYHVELDTHDVLIAEGVAAESYLNTGNRNAFESGGAPLDLHPVFETMDWSETCRPLVKSGPTVEAVKRQLIQRAESFGHVTSPNSDLHILADGCVVMATRTGQTYRFTLPDGCADIRLVSRRWVPAHLSPASHDDRELGVCVAQMEVDGQAVDLATMSSGWHDFEVNDVTSYRWTKGNADLPTGARQITVETCGAAVYWDTVSFPAVQDEVRRAA